jgi:hypothetical protein
MKTNDFLERYIKAQVEEDRVNEKKHSLNWATSDCSIRVTPEHFTIFYFKIKVKGKTEVLEIEEARGLAKYLLEATEGLENTTNMIEEIVRRKE